MLSLIASKLSFPYLVLILGRSSLILLIADILLEDMTYNSMSWMVSMSDVISFSYPIGETSETNCEYPERMNSYLKLGL